MERIGYGLVIKGTFYSTERYSYGSYQNNVYDFFGNQYVIKDITKVEEFRTSPVAFSDHQRLLTNRLNDEYKAYLLVLLDYCELPAVVVKSPK